MFEQADEFLAAQRIRRRLSNHSIRCYGSALTRIARWMTQHGENEPSEANIEAYLREIIEQPILAFDLRHGDRRAQPVDQVLQVAATDAGVDHAEAASPGKLHLAGRNRDHPCQYPA